MGVLRGGIARGIDRVCGEDIVVRSCIMLLHSGQGYFWREAEKGLIYRDSTQGRQSTLRNTLSSSGEGQG